MKMKPPLLRGKWSSSFCRCLLNRNVKAIVLSLTISQSCSLAMAGSLSSEKSGSSAQTASSKTLSKDEIVISGTVKDEKGETLPGVSVKVRGTTKGTSTDPNGKYTIKTAENAVLIFSFIGFESVEVAVAKRETLDVVLKSSSSTLDEVVIVGYGKQKRVLLTGSVATVDAKTFENRGIVPNPLAALQGQVPGVIVTRNTAAPGQEGWNFQIRGASSVNATEPLIVVDGVPQVNTATLNSINPSDIENISFLKDAAAAIYGSRAAGGVVLITTKRAKTGKPTIEYNGSYSSKQIGLRPHFIKGSQYGELMLQAINNSSTGGVADPNWLWTKYAISWTNPPVSGYVDKKVPGYQEAIGFNDVFDYTYFDTTPYDILFGNGRTNSTQHDLSFSGQSESLGYRASFGYLNDGSFLKWGNNSNNRYNSRVNLDYKLGQRVKVQTNLSLERNDVVFPTRADQINVMSQPGFPVATINGKPYAWGTQPARNWLLELGGDNKSFNTRIHATTNATLNLSKDLNMIAQGGYYWNVGDNQVQYKYIPEIFNYTETHQYAGNPRQDQSYYSRSFGKESYFSTSGYLEYKKSLKKHSLGATLGASYERDEYDFISTRTNYLASNDVPSLSLGLGDNTTRSNGQSRGHFAIGSAYGRLNYVFADKYLFEFNGRLDGTSRFAPGNRGIFYSGLQAGWRLSEEKFMKGISFLNELKLRGSAGATGNPTSQIGMYDYLQLLSISSNGPVLGGYTSKSVTATPSDVLPSPTRSWERVKNVNAAVDFGVLRNRLSGTFEYYWKRNTSVLLYPVYSEVLGANPSSDNIGVLKVWGWDLSLGWKDKIGDNFSYYVNGTLTDNNNKLVEYGGLNVVNGGQRSVEGYPLNSYFGLRYDGRIQTAEEAAEYAKYVTGNNIGMPGVTQMIRGINRYKDLNGDGKLTNAGANQYTRGFKDSNGNPIADGDMEYLGRPDPRYVFGLNLGGSWNGFDLWQYFRGLANA